MMDGIGITRGMSFAEYLALPGEHFSRLKTIDLSPLHYKHATAAAADVETDAMALGRIVHAMILTGTTPDDVVLYEGKTRRGKAWEAFKAAHPGQLITRKSELTTAGLMHNAVMRCPEARALLQQGEGELTVRWRSHGVRCRGRLDWYTGEQIVELKTTRSIDPKVFMREVAARHYHAQIAFYSSGYAAATGAEPPVLPALIAVESAPPFDVCVYRVGFDALEAGARTVERWLTRLSTCMASGFWPGVSFGAVVDLKLPEWAASDGLPDVDMSGIEEG